MELAVYETEVPRVLVVDGPSGRERVAADGPSGGEQVAADGPSGGERVAAELGNDVALETVAELPAVLDRIPEARATLPDDAVDCLLVGEPPADATTSGLIEAVRERDADLPIVVAPESGSVEEARDVTTAGASCYVPLEVADDGELAGVVADAVDEFDGRRQADRERSMFHELLTNTPLSVYFKDEQGRHVGVSSEATAYRDESVVGKTDYDLYADDIGEEQALQSYEDDLYVLESEEPIVKKEERHVTHGGDVTWLRTTKVPWRDEDGDVVGLIGITRAVTELKERELELEQEKQRLEQFASFVSHDLRNPVSVAKGYLEHGLETGDEEALEEVAHSLDRMDRMIDDLLYMARPQDQQEMKEWTDLREVVDRTWEAVDAGDATLRVAVPAGTRIMGTRGSLRQVLENLFKNSLDHGGRDVTVEVGVNETGFYVADDGPGIPESDRDQVFDYGYTTGGTGVGLAIVREIADAHRWRAEVRESEDGGARFEFRGCVLEPPDVEEVAGTATFDLDSTSSVGGAEPVGDAHRDGAGAWTVRGGGGNVWAEIEEFYAVHGDFRGDLRLEGRIASLESIHEYSKACLFVTDDVETGGPIVGGGMTASHGSELFWRSDPADAIRSTQYRHTSALPLWIRMDRIGDRVTLYSSRDGEDWNVLDQVVASLPETVTLGALVCSHNEERLCEASFDNLRAVPLEVAVGAGPTEIDLEDDPTAGPGPDDDSFDGDVLEDDATDRLGDEASDPLEDDAE